MANENKKTTEERVDVFIPRGGVNEDPNLYVCINGKEFLLPRGQVSNVPVYVKDAVDCLFRTQSYQEKHSQELIAKTLKPTNM
jgi:hypothetical protein